MSILLYLSTTTKSENTRFYVGSKLHIHSQSQTMHHSQAHTQKTTSAFGQSSKVHSAIPEVQSSLSQLESQLNSTSQQPLNRKREGPFRGPSRALKYKKLRYAQLGKVKVLIPTSLGAAVGEHALQFVGECADWVKEICPLNVVKWNDMPEDKLNQLYGRIKAKFSLGEEAHIPKAMKTQCSNLYRHWRERLKRDHFTNSKSLKEPEHACPKGVDLDEWKWIVYSYWGSLKQRQRSEKNRANALSKTIHSACGGRSTARYIYEMDLKAEAEAQDAAEDAAEASESASDATKPPNDNPKYMKLWEKTKRHKDGTFDDDGEVIFEEFKKLHEKEIQEKVVDDLTVDEAYSMVLGHCSGYARGLGRGHPVLHKDGKKGKAEMEAEVQQLRMDNSEMRAEIEFLKAESARKEKEAKEKEERLEREAKEKEERMEKKLQFIMKTIGLT